jgi:hypothetical protein
MVGVRIRLCTFLVFLFVNEGQEGARVARAQPRFSDFILSNISDLKHSDFERPPRIVPHRDSQTFVESIPRIVLRHDRVYPESGRGISNVGLLVVTRGKRSRQPQPERPRRGQALEYFVIYGPSPKEILGKYTALTGRPGYTRYMNDRDVLIARVHDGRGAPVSAAPTSTWVKAGNSSHTNSLRWPTPIKPLRVLTPNSPISVGALSGPSFAHEVERAGRTSMGVRIEVIALRDRGATEVKVTEGLFTFVALDQDNRPRAVDP